MQYIILMKAIVTVNMESYIQFVLAFKDYLEILSETVNAKVKKRKEESVEDYERSCVGALFMLAAKQDLEEMYDETLATIIETGKDFRDSIDAAYDFFDKTGEVGEALSLLLKVIQDQTVEYIKCVMTISADKPKIKYCEIKNKMKSN